jgi:hypothetical protein
MRDLENQIDPRAATKREPSSTISMIESVQMKKYMKICSCESVDRCICEAETRTL